MSEEDGLGDSPAISEIIRADFIESIILLDTILSKVDLGK